VVITKVTSELRSEDLFEEVRRYLIAIEAFRAAGCEPRWQPEAEVRTAVGPGLEPFATLAV